MQKIIIFGASSQSDPVLDCIQKEGKFKVVGFIDSFKKKGQRYRGIEILGTEQELPTVCVKYEIYGGIVGTQNNYMRKCIVDKVLSILPQFNFVSTIYPTAIIGPNVTLGDGVVIMPGAVVKKHSKIADFCFVGSNSVLENHGSMNSFSSLADNVYCGGYFNLGMFSAICLGTTIEENINVGDHSVAFAGSIVTEDVADNVLALFMPSKGNVKNPVRPIAKKKRHRSSSSLF